MDVRGALRADRARPDLPTDRAELPFLCVAAVGLVVIAQWTRPGTALDLLLVTPAVAAFALRGLLPHLPDPLFGVVTVASTTATVVVSSGLEGVLMLNVVMVLYTAWHLGSTLVSVAVAAMASIVPWATATVFAGDDDPLWAVWVLASLLTWTAGRLLHRQQVLIAELETARTALAERAVAEERRRIARELHDLAGHTLAAMLLHVTGARHVLHRDPADAERALTEAEAVGRASLGQMRATVRALRTDERGTDPALPDAGRLVEVVDEYRRAGLAVEADLDAAASATGPTAVALHRILRETLANVARHAPANRVVVTVAREGGDLRLRVTDHGGAPARSGGDAGHFGLVGMAERARSLGGELDAGPTADGWRVEAVLPVPDGAGPVDDTPPVTA